MNRIRTTTLVVGLSIAAVAMGADSLNTTPPAEQQGADLTKTITDLDARVFDAYNRCDLAAFAGFFSPRVEFYHDQGGATFDRDTVVANTRKYICHKVRRQLLPETFRVYPIKGYGAIEEGEHRFCQTVSGTCEGIARFLMIWQRQGERWQLTRVISYGHRSVEPSAP